MIAIIGRVKDFCQKETFLFVMGFLFLLNILFDAIQSIQSIQEFLENQIVPIIAISVFIALAYRFKRTKKFLIGVICFAFVYKSLEFGVVIVALMTLGFKW